jgi:putative intracellular protease/amidase
VTAFSNEEEQAVHLTDTVPFLLEARLKELGATYEQAVAWAPFAVRDGMFVTGQNPQSSAAAAREAITACSGPASG